MPGLHGGVIRTVGACAYCEMPTMDACVLCGRPVCVDHEMEDRMICLACARGAEDD